MSKILHLSHFKKADDFFWKQKIKLCDFGSVSFFWSDSDEFCLNLKKLIECHPEFQDIYQQKIESLEALKKIPVWFKVKSKVIEKNMFELYEDHILGKDLLPIHSQVECSFLSSKGPFNKLIISELLNPVMYQEFIMVLLLSDKLNRRQFRLRMNSRLLMEQNHSIHLVNFEQLSTDGILISSEKPLVEATLNFFLDYQVLSGTDEMTLDELKNYLSTKAINFLYSAQESARIPINTQGIHAQVKFDCVKNNLYYYFIEFNRFENKDAVKTLQQFVTHSKDLITESLKRAA